MKRLRTLTNQRLALLFNNAIGPEQEPMRARLTLLEFELNMIRRSPAVAGDGPSFRLMFAEGILLSLQLISNNSIAVKKIAFFPL